MARTSPGDRELDLVLVGATGFTGGLVARDLAARLAGSRLRWAIAGRDAARLAALAEELGGPAVRVVDAHDAAGLAALARSTRVVASTVGPYALHGLPLARACAEAGTDLADITGEPAFVARLRRELDPVARASGARLVSCCGFDSVPHDLGAAMAAAALPQDGPIELRGYVRARGGMSGGTAASALGAVAAPRGPRGRRGSSEGDGEDGGGIRPAASAPGAPAPRRRAGRLPVGVHRVAALGGFGVPLPTIDASIVLASARVLDGYGTEFRYGHYALVRRRRTVVLAGGALAAALALARFGPTRALIARRLPSPGEGPDEATRAAGRFTVTFLGRGGGAEVVARVSGGDPGYGETSRMLAEAALALAEDDLADVAGVLTPAVALGAPYRRRLEARGMRFEVDAPSPGAAT